MRTFIWPFNWYSDLQQAKRELAQAREQISALTEMNRKLSAEVIASGIALQGITATYMASLDSIYKEQRERYKQLSERYVRPLGTPL